MGRRRGTAHSHPLLSSDREVALREVLALGEGVCKGRCDESLAALALCRGEVEGRPLLRALRDDVAHALAVQLSREISLGLIFGELPLTSPDQEEQEGYLGAVEGHISDLLLRSEGGSGEALKASCHPACVRSAAEIMAQRAVRNPEGIARCACGSKEYHALCARLSALHGKHPEDDGSFASLDDEDWADALEAAFVVAEGDSLSPISRRRLNFEEVLVARIEERRTGEECPPWGRRGWRSQIASPL
jgi:hypothetical protein